MLKSITFTQEWRCFKVDDTFSFLPGVNLLVGDQGCGKSSLLSAIRNNGMKLSYSDPDHSSHKVAKVVVDAVADSFKFDFEKDSFRTRKYIGDNPMFQVMSHKVSHGEANRLVLDNLDGIKGSVIFMDEPDMALSIRSIYKLVAQMKQFHADGNQVIVAVHNPFVIQSFDNVLSLEHRLWMPGSDFIQIHEGVTSGNVN